MAEELKDTISKLLDRYKLAEPLAKFDIVNSWEVIMGKVIANHTLKVYIRGKVIYIHVDSSALRNELEYAQSTIIKLVNQHSGRQLINEVVLY
ncbi:MAG: DUF721 domain-containing protein [Bacteroidetes bacterium]|nr:DUF721 domain-containing protein [Bacteroidota bacterium]